MQVYLILLTVTILSLFLYKKTNILVFKILPYVIMAFIGGFRSEVGVDYISYRDQFYDVLLKRNWYDNMEIGYRTFIEIIHFIGGNYQMMFLIISVLTCFFYYKFISQNSEDYILSTMLYMCLGPFYISSYNAVRGAFAISVFLYSLKFIEKDIKKYVFCILFVSTFHISAIPFLLFPIVKKMRKNYITCMLFFSFMGIFIIQSDFLEIFLNKFMPIYSRYSEVTRKMDLSYIIYYLICLIVIIIDLSMRVHTDSKYMYMLVFTCILIFMGLVTGKFTMMLTRFISWGTPALIIVLPKIVKKIKPSFICYSMIYSFCIAYFLILVSTARTMLPYNFNFKIFS